MFPNFKWNIEVPDYVKQKINEVWYGIGQSVTQKTLVGFKCPICLEYQWLGERHLTCRMNTSPEYTCIICLKDERSGNHSICKFEIMKKRNEIISIFRNSSR
jgi:hypothetical protein